jgi:hypothetical protein
MNERVAPPANGLTAAQRADLATLLAQNLLARGIRWLAERVLSADAVVDVANNPEIDMLAKTVVERMHDKGRLEEAISILRTEGRNGDLLRGLNHILSGDTLADLAGLQANVQAADDPFFSNDFLETFFPRVQRTVCAIGLGDPQNRLMGTGFLIAPDLVMTNFHVVESFLTVQPENDADKITTTVSGDKIYCFFDYLSGPRPRVPPDDTRPHPSVLVKAVTDGWLVRARCRLDKEGIYPYAQTAHNKYDYAIIRLERAVGSVPSTRSGGALRGWLTLNSEINFLQGMGSRLVVLQHPGGAEQLWDVGIYDRMDPSQTRIWYSVNAERGASGGPAVDKQGRLFALHNASVRGPDGLPLSVNQGVRIDVISNDLRLDPAIVLPPWKEDNPGYWTLSDNLSDPKPIIGRQLFRESVAKMMDPKGDRILTVLGPKDSGRRFSVDLLRRIVGATVPIISFGPNELGRLKPRDFVRALATDLMLPNIGTIPEARQTESTSRSFSSDLPVWLAQQLVADYARNPGRYPVWIVINAVVDEGQRLSWAEDLPDLLSDLMGPPDTAQTPPDLPHLRWLLLGSPNSAFPPTRAEPMVDDLTTAPNTNYSEEFANCMSLAWRSIERTASMSFALLKNMGTTFVNDAIRDKKIARAYLAEYVRRFILGQ